MTWTQDVDALLEQAAAEGRVPGAVSVVAGPDGLLHESAAGGDHLVAAGAEMLDEREADAAVGAGDEDGGHQSGSTSPEPPISEGTSRILATPSWMRSTVSW